LQRQKISKDHPELKLDELDAKSGDSDEKDNVVMR